MATGDTTATEPAAYNPNTNTNSRSILFWEKTNITPTFYGPLHLAARKGNLEKLQILLQNGEDPNEKTGAGSFALYLAVKQNHTKAVELLLQNGANPNLKTKHFGNTSLQLAVKQNHTEAVELLLQYGADPNQETSRGITVLHQAVIKDKKDIAQILLKHGVNLDKYMVKDTKSLFKKNTEFKSAKRILRPAIILFLICETKNNKQITKKIDAIFNNLQNGINFKIKGKTPLHYAVKSRNLQMVDALLNAGADSSMQDNEGKTPLHYAVKSRNLQMVEALLNAVDANSSMLDNEGKVPLDYNPLPKDSSMQDNEGKTPVHYAVKSRNLQMVEALLNVGANSIMQDNEGKTPLHYAVKSRNLQMVEALLNAVDANSSK